MFKINMLPNIFYKFSDPLCFTFVKSVHKKTFLGYQILTLNHGGGGKWTVQWTILNKFGTKSHKTHTKQKSSYPVCRAFIA